MRHSAKLVPPEISSPLFSLRNFQDFEENVPDSCRMDWNLINDEEFWFKKLLKLGPNNSNILKNWFPPKISSLLFNLYKFQDSLKSPPESCRIHWNVMNDDEIGSKKLSKFKYRRGDQKIQTFCKIGSPQKLVPPL